MILCCNDFGILGLLFCMEILSLLFIGWKNILICEFFFVICSVFIIKLFSVEVKVLVLFSNMVFLFLIF